MLALVFSGEPVVSVTYFQAVAQILPVILVALVVQEVAVQRGAGDWLMRIRSATERMDELLAAADDDDEAQRARFASEREAIERAANRLPDVLHAATADIRRVLIAFVFAEAAALYSLAAAEQSVSIAFYVAIVLIVVTSVFARSLLASITMASSVAYIDLTGLDEGSASDHTPHPRSGVDYGGETEQA